MPCSATHDFYIAGLFTLSLASTLRVGKVQCVLSATRTSLDPGGPLLQALDHADDQLGDEGGEGDHGSSHGHHCEGSTRQARPEAVTSMTGSPPKNASRVLRSSPFPRSRTTDQLRPSSSLQRSSSLLARLTTTQELFRAEQLLCDGSVLLFPGKQIYRWQFTLPGGLRSTSDGVRYTLSFTVVEPGVLVAPETVVEYDVNVERNTELLLDGGSVPEVQPPPKYEFPPHREPRGSDPEDVDGAGAFQLSQECGRKREERRGELRLSRRQALEQNLTRRQVSHRRELLGRLCYSHAAREDRAARSHDRPRHCRETHTSGLTVPGVGQRTCPATRLLPLSRFFRQRRQQNEGFRPRLLWGMPVPTRRPSSLTGRVLSQNSKGPMPYTLSYNPFSHTLSFALPTATSLAIRLHIPSDGESKSRTWKQVLHRPPVVPRDGVWRGRVGLGDGEHGGRAGGAGSLTDCSRMPQGRLKIKLRLGWRRKAGACNLAGYMDGSATNR